MANNATFSGPKASWPVSLGWFVVGAFVTITSGSIAGILAGNLGSGAGGMAAQLAVGAGIISVFFVARELPRRARALFVAGAVAPVVLAVIAFALLLWALAHSNFTF